MFSFGSESPFEAYLDQALAFAPKLLAALLVIVVGLYLCGRVRRLVDLGFEKRGLDPSLRHFLAGILSALLKVAVFLASAEVVGIKTTSFIAILGAAGLAVGLALQGSLANFAGGVVILLFKPFKVGDYIKAQGEAGSVTRIDIFHTWLNTPDNQRVIIPNGPLATGNITNFSAEATRRVDIDFGVAYDSDLKKVKEILLGFANDETRVLKDPAPFVGLKTMGDFSLNFTLRMWVEASNYWPVYWDCMERIKTEFDAHGIEIPYPRQDLTLLPLEGTAGQGPNA